MHLVGMEAGTARAVAEAGVTKDLDFDEFFRATWPRLFRTAYAVAGDAVSAEDALQAGFAIGGSDDPQSGRGIDPIGQLDFSGGLRAYAGPGAEIHLGGRAFPGGRRPQRSSPV
jgi:hypothetical protein